MGVRNLDLGSMINLSIRVNKTWPNSTQKQAAYWKVWNFLDVIFGFGRNCSPMKSMWYYGFIAFLSKQNSPSALNRINRISKSELYHTSQQLSRHDCPIRVFFPLA
jgi:hypothetical protein